MIRAAWLGLIAAFAASAALAQPARPDLTGKWVNATPMAALKTDQGSEPPLNDKGRALLAKRKADPKSDPIRLCQLPGEPRLLYTAYPFLILQYTDHVDFVHEVNHISRFVDFVAKYNADAGPNWLGNATARWDGPVLVVDGHDYNDKTWLDYQGLPHGEKLKTEERYALAVDGKSIKASVRIDDPDYYTQPWTTTFTLKKLPGFLLKESVCEEDHHM
jgi:hypothetical protein